MLGHDGETEEEGMFQQLFKQFVVDLKVFI